MIQLMDDVKAAPEVGRKPRILVVEDLEDARTMLQLLLAISLKLPVDTAVDGADGLRMLTNSNYSVVVTDLRMPNLNGMQLITEIEKRKIPVTIIVTTGHGNQAEANEALEHGAHDFMIKPVDPEKLIAKIKRILRDKIAIN